MRIFSIHAQWDPEAQVWVATSEDVPGLATEAESVDALFEKLRVIVPELLEANGIVPNHPDEIPIELLAHRQEQFRARM